MQKKSSINAAFIYAISAVVVILVLYLGYRVVVGIQKSNERAIVERMQIKLRSDMNKLAIRYGSEGFFSYDVGKAFSTACFVDLFLNSTDEEARNIAINSTDEPPYNIIWDSVKENSTNNVFIMGENLLIFNAGKLHVGCQPYVFCINITRGKLEFYATASGDSVVINCSQVYK